MKDHCACNGMPCEGICKKTNGEKCQQKYDKKAEDRQRHRDIDYKKERKSNE